MHRPLPQSLSDTNDSRRLCMGCLPARNRPEQALR